MDLRDRLQSALGNAYKFERKLGGGGMSRAFVARERSPGRSVVIKVLGSELSGDAAVVTDFGIAKAISLARTSTSDGSKSRDRGVSARGGS
ncbi:MAG: hypothetical protein ABR582_02370 [Gemmatimonadaceae bacterium]